MDSSPTGVVAELQKKYENSPITDQLVRAQTTGFIAEHWRKRWPEHLAVPEVLETEEKYVRVSRQQLFDAAETVRDEADAIELYVKVAGWGTGPMARPAARVVRVLDDPDAPKKLLDAFHAAREAEPVEAYATLRYGGANRIPYFGPAFFTKWLYFSAGAPSAPGERTPLILDRRVSLALGWSETTGWKTARYGEYLDLAEEIRRLWVPDLPTHVVEYGLFMLNV